MAPFSAAAASSLTLRSNQWELGQFSGFSNASSDTTSCPAQGQKGEQSIHCLTVLVNKELRQSDIKEHFGQNCILGGIEHTKRSFWTHRLEGAREDQQVREGEKKYLCPAPRAIKMPMTWQNKERLTATNAMVQPAHEATRTLHNSPSKSRWRQSC